ncbi:MAG TPA: hypothetical protein VHU40_01285 [Polyangia bacterium]|jgi:hypothetical protein|nr:hypothetical protein [Polyangia bacterium]
MGLRLVNDPMERTSERNGDDRESLAEARRAVAGARARLEGIADRLAQFSRRLGEGSRAAAAGPGPGETRGGSLPGDGS